LFLVFAKWIRQTQTVDVLNYSFVLCSLRRNHTDGNADGISGRYR